MKNWQKALLVVGGIAAIAAAGTQTTPLLNSFLQSNMNANTFNISNLPGIPGQLVIFGPNNELLPGGVAPVIAPSISSFVNNIGTVEIGSTVNSTVLTWTLGGTTPTFQTINQGLGSVPVGTLTKTDSSSYTSSRTYTLTITNANGSASASTTVSFLNKRYWGPQALTSLNDAQIIALNSEFASSYVGFNHTIVCAAEYIYFAFPQSFGVPNVNVNGLLNTAWTITSRAFVNASGASVNYYIYRSNNLLTGTYIVQLVP